MLRYAHYTAKTERQLCIFSDIALANLAWTGLRAAFPGALAATLMPDHLHLVAPDRGEAGAIALRRVLKRLVRHLDGPWTKWWAPVPLPEAIASREKLRRSVRYVWLNPCRPWGSAVGAVQLIDDPLVWPWSTLRDAVGAIIDPWTPAARVVHAFGWADARFPEHRLHAYATRDEHVSRGARLFPEVASPRTSSLKAVQLAALAATRARPEALRRRGRPRRVMVGLAYQQGWDRPQRLAEQLGVHPDSVSRIARSTHSDETGVAALCLDPRLQRGPEVVEQSVQRPLATRAA